jgi:hypothetical protein
MTSERIYQIYTSRGYEAARQVAQMTREQHLVDLVEKLQHDRRRQVEQRTRAFVAFGDILGCVYRDENPRKAYEKAFEANCTYA